MDKNEKKRRSSITEDQRSQVPHQAFEAELRWHESLFEMKLSFLMVIFFLTLVVLWHFFSNPTSIPLPSFRGAGSASTDLTQIPHSSPPTVSSRLPTSQNQFVAIPPVLAPESANMPAIERT